jgi:hypothetical protein
MRKWGDRRAVSPVVGFVILFGFFTLSMTLWQVQVVPAHNAGEEYEHQQEVTKQLIQLRNAILEATMGADRSVQIALGTTYPDRTLFVNPPPPVGDLRTNDADRGQLQIRIENATAADDAPPGVANRWNGTTRIFESAPIIYRPGYHSYEGAEEVAIEHTLMYSQWEATRVEHTDHAVVDGTTIRLPLLPQNVSRRSLDRVEVTAGPVASTTRTVPVTSNDTAPITLTLETPAPDTHAALLNDTETITNVTPNANNVSFELQPGRYDLAVASIALDGYSPHQQMPTYTAIVEGADATISPGEKQQVVVEVRDSEDNPMANEPVNLTLDDPGLASITPASGTTNENGRFEATIVGTVRGSTNLTVSHDGSATNATTNLTISGGTVRWDSGTLSAANGDVLEVNATSTVEDAPVSFAVNSTSILSIRPGDTSDRFTNGTATLSVDVSWSGKPEAYAYVYSLGEGDRLTIKNAN